MSQKDSYNIDAVDAASKEIIIDKKVTFSHLSSLNEFIDDQKYIIDCKISFSKVKKNIIIHGEIKGTISLICQLTLEAFEFDIEKKFDLGLVTDDRFFKDFEKGVEPLISADGIVDIIQIIDEEILLTIPMIPKKETNDCKKQNNGPYYSAGNGDDASVNKTVNPFEILKNIKL